MLTRPPARSNRPAKKLRFGQRLRITLQRPGRRWLKVALYAVGGLSVLLVCLTIYFWVSFARMIDARLGGDQRAVPRIFGRPFDLHVGQGLSPSQLVQRLNDVGYAERPKVAEPGEFSVAGSAVTLRTRPVDGSAARTVRADFARGPIVARLTSLDGRPTPLDRIALEAPLLAALAQGEKRRNVPLTNIPRVMINAVLAVEDHRFFEHPGVDPIGSIGALITNIRGNKPYLVGGSTITQQIVKNTFLTPAKTLGRKLQEQFMALVLDSRFTKSQILELYLNDVVLGQHGPFEIHGVGEAARIFFGKDVSNVSLAEAATIAGLIQSPSRLSPLRNPDRAKERRNVVLKEMADAGMVPKAAADKASREPMTVTIRALENEAPYFVDYVSQLVDQKYADLLKKQPAADVYTTLDLHLQRFAQESLAEGLLQVDKQLAKRKAGQAEAALVAVDPRTGEILAFVGGRSYSHSQFDRAVAAKRQPGSVFKPFVYLAAFERMADEGRGDLTPATVVTDEPTTFRDGDKDYTPANYQNEYEGPITLRRALAHSRNIVAIKVAEATGYDLVADLWQRVGVGTAAKPYPSIALGVFEATPLDLATAYTLFTNGGAVRPLSAVTRIVEPDKTLVLPAADLRRVARPETTFLVTNMMRAVLNEGTGAGARGANFLLDAAGKTGTTNDLRDAWFIGFTPELLTVVWVGLDNNQPIGLSGSQAALPIWTTFMKKALAARPSVPFDPPEGVAFADVDAENGKLATPDCPKVVHEAFLPGTEPRQYCDIHGRSLLSLFRRIFGRAG